MPRLAVPLTALALSALIALATAGCAAERDAAGVHGLWEGRLEYPGLTVRVALRIAAAPDGGLAAVLLLPDQGDRTTPFDEVAWRDGRLRLALREAHLVFEGRLVEGGEALAGRWEQPPFSQDVTLRRVAEIAAPPRPQIPLPPFPYRTEDVEYVNEDAGVHLAGTMTLPAGAGPFPAALLVPGVGAHERDYTVLGHRRFLVLADHLARRGVACLRFDERGAGESGGDASAATSADYAGDALAGVRFLRVREGVDPARVGIVGHSEGGTVAALAAARSPDVAFIVMLASPGLPGRETNLRFEASMGRAMGRDSASLAEGRRLQGRVLDIVAGEADSTAAAAEIRRLLADLEPPMPAERVEGAVRRFLSPWFRFNLRHDPGETLRQVRCPVLAAIGGLDRQVPPGENLAAMARALAEGGNDDFTVYELPNLNHFLQTVASGAPAEYGSIEETLAPAAMDLVTGWILARGEP
ncbi:MAG: alpha/beta fold hydrolase [Candidatus Krumholzibacteriota bacterium]|nr:alpha/beta fold hydrolase [Candidatus Krumholzibacteriota bacterium]